MRYFGIDTLSAFSIRVLKNQIIYFKKNPVNNVDQAIKEIEDELKSRNK